MADPPSHPAHYHLLTATERWCKYLDGIDKVATEPRGLREQQDRERQHDTVTERGERAKGGS